MIKKSTSIFTKWIEKLSDNIRYEIDVYIGRVLSGNFSNCKSVGEGIQELKINYQKGYRIYFTILDNKVILLLLSGGAKGGNQKRQNEDIRFAKDIKKYLKSKGVI
jgi:putative addiction module killer protein